MTQPKNRTDSKKFVRVPSGETRIRYFKSKAAKKSCSKCGRVLHGTAHGRRNSAIGKLSKTQKRPNVPFAGILCGNCREDIVKEAGKVKYGFKELGQVALSIKPFVEQIIKKVE